MGIWSILYVHPMIIRHRIVLTVAMETMHFFIVQLSLSLRTKILCISGVPISDLEPMKNCPVGVQGTVGQISSRSS